MANTVSISEAAKMLEVTEKTIRNYIKRGLVSPEKWNGMWQISTREIKEIYSKKNGTNRIDNVLEDLAIGVSKDEYSEQMIGLGKLQAYENHLADQKSEIEKLNTRIVQLEASSASGWTEARAAQQRNQEMADEISELQEKDIVQREELAWLRREKDGLGKQLEKEEKRNRKLVQKVKALEDQLHLQSVLG